MRDLREMEADEEMEEETDAVAYVEPDMGGDQGSLSNQPQSSND